MSTQLSVKPELAALAAMDSDGAFKEVKRLAADESLTAQDIAAFLCSVDETRWSRNDKRGVPSDKLAGIMWARKPDGVSPFAHAKFVLETAIEAATKNEDCFYCPPMSLLEYVSPLVDMIDSLSTLERVDLCLTLFERSKSQPNHDDVLSLACDLLDVAELTEGEMTGPLQRMFSYLAGNDSNGVAFEDFVGVIHAIRSFIA